MQPITPLPPVPQPDDSTLARMPVLAGQAAAPLASPSTTTAWSSEHLFGGRTEIEITHGPHRYRLRQTSLGKLILTK